MSTTLNKAYFKLPSVHKFVQRIVEAAINRSNLLLLIPDLIDKGELLEVISRALWKEEIYLLTIDLPASLPEGDFLQYLAKTCLTGDYHKPSQITDLMDNLEFPDVVILNASRQLAPEFQTAWIDFLATWAGASQQQANLARRQSVICLLVDSCQINLARLPSDVYLQALWWWGFPSALEMSLLCRQDVNAPPDIFRDRWREKLLPSLAAGDIHLFEHLWEHILHDEVSLGKAILEYELPFQCDEQEKRVLQEIVLSRNGYRQVTPGDPPPVRLRALWAKSYIYHTVEFGTELHPKVLARLEETDLIRHRLWRGQTELLLPIIDRLRHNICADLTTALGDDWPWRWDVPDDEEERYAVQNNPFSTQLGYLLHLLKHNNKFIKFNRWVSALDIAHDIRNDLAHFGLVSFRKSEKLLSTIS
jgi:hypothetical protein